MSHFFARRFINPPAFAAAGLTLLLAAPAAQAKEVISADGPGGTYALSGRVFSLETPDCGHKVEHISEVFDDELKKNVFVFHAHVKEDDDRCGAQDRQRTEIRGGKLADVYANSGQTTYYRWKFKLPTGFQASPNFTHIMQLKSDAAAPILTLTPRNNTMAIDGRIGARGATDLAKFVGVWVVANMKITHADNGNVSLNIRRIPDGQMLFDYTGGADTLDGGNQDPKWGIYRSLNTPGALRDEQVRFADFCISKTSAADCEGSDDNPVPTSDAGVGPGPSADADVPPTPSDAGPTPTPGSGGAAGSGGSGGSAGSGGSTGGAGGSGGSGTPPSSTPDPSKDAGAGGKPRDAAAPSPTPPGDSSGGGSSGGCSLAPGASATVVGVLGLLLAAVLMVRRRR